MLLNILSRMSESPPPSGPVSTHTAQPGEARIEADEAATALAARRLVRADAQPWLNLEIERRLGQKLDFLRIQPQRAVDWGAWQGQASPELTRRYPKAACLALQPPALRRADIAPAEPTRGARGWLKRIWPATGGAGSVAIDESTLEPATAQLVWANMLLHTVADPVALMRRWHRVLAIDGFLMFSTLGPDTVRELRRLYERGGFGAPAQDFRDMHDVGDMLVGAGFADPVMDMERLRVTWGDASALLADLRAWGVNSHPRRFAGCRTPRWLAGLKAGIERELRGTDGRLSLSFEVVYGHAVKPVPRARVAEQSSIALDDMRAMMRSGRAKKPEGGV